MLDLSFLNLSPPIVSLSDASVDDISTIIEGDFLKTHEKNVLKALLEVSREKERSYCSGNELSAYLGSSNETVRKALSSMAVKQLFEKIDCKTKANTRRKAILYRLNSQAVVTTESSLSSSNNNDDLKSLVNPDDEMYGKVEELIFKLAVSLEHSHKSELKSKKAIIYIDKEPVTVLVESSGNNSIARVRDLRYYVATLRLCFDIMKRRFELYKQKSIDLTEVLKPLFLISETDLLRSMNLDVGTTSRKHAHNSMVRLDRTTYKITSAPQSFMKRLNLKEYMSKVSHFDMRKYAKTNDDRVAYQLELSNAQVQSLYMECTKEEGESLLLTVDHRIYNERNPLAFIFTFFASSMKPGAINRYTFQSLKDNIAPNMNLRDFKIQLSSLLYKNRVKQHDENGDEVDYIKWNDNKKIINVINARLNGIEVSIPDGEVIYVQKDTNYKALTVNKRISSKSINKRISPKYHKKHVPNNPEK